MDTKLNPSKEGDTAELRHAESRTVKHVELVKAIATAWDFVPTERKTIRAMFVSMVKECPEETFHFMIEGFVLQAEINLKKIQDELARRAC